MCRKNYSSSFKHMAAYHRGIAARNIFISKLVDINRRRRLESTRRLKATKRVVVLVSEREGYLR